MKHRDDEFGEMPDWNPSTERDERWEGMNRLMREAGEPAMPSRAEFRALKQRLREELQPGRSGGRESFVGWLGQMLFGGGPGAHVVRLGAVGALAFLIGRQGTVEAPVSPAASSGQSAVAADSRVPVPSGRPAAPAGIAPSDSIVAVSNAPVYRRVDFQPGDADQITSISRSGIAEDGSLKEFEDTWQDLGLTSGHSGDGQWYVVSHVGQEPSGGISPAGMEGYRLVRSMRLDKSMADPEAIRQIEESMAKGLLREPRMPKDRAAALNDLRRADELLAAGWSQEAFDSYRQLVAAYPDTFFAFLADYQSAEIAFDKLQDYETALQTYGGILEEYPSEYLSDRQREHLIDRVRLLTHNYMKDWEAVRLYQQAHKLSGRERSEALKRLIQAVPESPLAVSTAVDLAQEASRFDDRTSRADLRELEGVLQTAIDKSEQEGGYRFALGELRAFGLLEPERAANDYREAIRSAGGEAYATQARARLERIE